MKVRAIARSLGPAADAAGPDWRRAENDGRLDRHAGQHHQRKWRWRDTRSVQQRRNALLDGPVAKIGTSCRKKAWSAWALETAFAAYSQQQAPVTRSSMDGINACCRTTCLNSFEPAGRQRRWRFPALRRAGNQDVDDQENPAQHAVDKFYERNT
jgi:hypothetical protein